MHNLLYAMPASSSPSSFSKPSKSSAYPNPTASQTSLSSSCSYSSSSSSSSVLLCKHSVLATLDIIILFTVLCAGAFLITSYFVYVFNSVSLLLSHSSIQLPPAPYVCGFLAFFLFSVLFIEFCCGPRSRKCDKPGCKGLKKAMEFDLQLQTEDSAKSNGAKEIDKLPWKGGSERNPDYECLRAELRKMAPPNGRAVLLFRARCGCPVAKLEGLGPKRGRRHKKTLANVGAASRDLHR